jgi:hypothetical protein
VAADDAETGVRSPEQPRHLAFARTERANLDAALAWATAHEPETALRIALGFGWAWAILGAGPDTAGRIRAALAAATYADPVDRSRALLLAGWLGLGWRPGRRHERPGGDGAARRRRAPCSLAGRPVQRRVPDEQGHVGRGHADRVLPAQQTVEVIHRHDPARIVTLRELGHDDVLGLDAVTQLQAGVVERNLPRPAFVLALLGRSSPAAPTHA